MTQYDIRIKQGGETWHNCLLGLYDFENDKVAHKFCTTLSEAFRLEVRLSKIGGLGQYIGSKYKGRLSLAKLTKLPKTLRF